MSWLFSSPVDRAINKFTHLHALQSNDSVKRKKAATKIGDTIASMHLLLYGDCDIDNEPRTETAERLVSKILNSEIFTQFVEYILAKEFKISAERLELITTAYIRDFNIKHTTYIIPQEIIPICMKYFPVYKYSINPETKSKTTSIMNYIIRRSASYNVAQYIKSKTHNNGYNVIINTLFIEYKDVFVVGSVLQEIVKRPELALMMLFQITINGTNVVNQLFNLAQQPSFNIAAGAYKILQILLTRHKKLVATYLETNYVNFFSSMNTLVQTGHYVTVRQFLHLLNEILVQKANNNAMIRYIAEKQNLKIVMNLLKSKSEAIQFEAFEIFTLFVSNPKKARDIHIVLWKNKAKLIRFFSTFLTRRAQMEDVSFGDKKRIVVKYLEDLSIPEEIILYRKRKESNK
eukprot:106460_1